MQARGITVRETVDAKKQRYGEEDLATVFAGASTVVVAKGKNAARFAADDPALRAAALGPSGNLRAPAVRSGDRWLIGFHEQSWAEALR